MTCLLFIDGELLVSMADKEKIILLTRDDIKSLNQPLKIIEDTEKLFVAYIDKDNFNAAMTMPPSINIRQALCYFDQDICYNLIYYLQLVNYYLAHKFCGICGNILLQQKNNKYMLCTECQREAYPKLSPCIIVRITRGEQILLARGSYFPTNVWALIAGFIELGENCEEAIQREVMEEVGISIDNIRYWGSQSWPVPTSSLMLGFTAEYKSGEIKVDNEEIVEAGFFTKETIPGKPPTHFSIASQMIEEFLGS